MGKVKTVQMGDVEAEEAARKKAEVKRAQKKIASPSARNDTPIEAKPKQEKKLEKKKSVNKYVFPRGKKYLEAKGKVDSKKLYPLTEAISLVKATSTSKFDGTMEMHINVSDKGIRGSVALPHGTGKDVRVKIADEQLITSLSTSGKIDFDILVATPEMMAKLAKVAKILGPKGLMPNPKNGTIGSDPEKLAKELSKGQVQWKTEAGFPIVHTIFGKASFDDKKLAENFAVIFKSIGKEKIRSIFIKATMGPAVRVQV